jgi:hypothetical protein
MFGDEMVLCTSQKKNLPKLTSQVFGHRCKVTQLYQNYTQKYNPNVWYRM